METPLEIVCRNLTISEARRVARIPSGYENDRVFRLTRKSAATVQRWTLEETALPGTFRKTYDSGDLDEWLRSYLESAPADSLHFEGAFVGREIQGLLTWNLIEWNETVWLIDIRSRPNFRRRGIGTALITELKALSQSLGVRGISVETQISNYPAIQFYRKHGFEICGFNDHLYSNADLARQDVALYLFWERLGPY